MSKAEWENNEEIKIFREYLRIPSVHPNIDYCKLQRLLTISGCVHIAIKKGIIKHFDSGALTHRTITEIFQLVAWNS